MDKIICLGKNYADHIKEMKDVPPERPVLFLKPQSSFYEIDKRPIKLPWERGLIHHECEVVLKLYKKMVIAVGIGLDLTLRDVQKQLKEKGHPWEISKVFKNSAIVTPMRGTKDFEGDWQDTPFSLKINGETKQESKLSNAIMKANEIIHYVDEFFPLCDGDLIFTGTPAGVGPLNPGDVLEFSFGPIQSKFSLTT